MMIIYFHLNHSFILLHNDELRYIFFLLYLFLPLITYLYQLKDPILLWSFLKLLAMLILELKEILQDQVRIFQDMYSQSSQINQLTIMYHSQRTIRDILLIFFFKIVTNSFWVRIICISNILHV